MPLFQEPHQCRITRPTSVAGHAHRLPFLRLPKYAKVEELYGTGLLLPIGDYVEPALQVQNERLKLTNAGRTIRNELALSNADLPQILPTIPPWEVITVTDNRPLPKHLNQASDKQRRDYYAQRHIQFLKNSQQVIQTLQTRSKIPAYARRILNYAAQLQQRSIRVRSHWIPGHTSIPGSDLVHQRALQHHGKEQLEEDSSKQTATPFQDDTHEANYRAKVLRRRKLRSSYKAQCPATRIHPPLRDHNETLTNTKLHNNPSASQDLPGYIL
ncbi:hypothetical protein HPB50_010566 [Hyalomma asiaticum]|uniref:Uncharacterized protein n=1 Tax=Hyalomma asiaticum TaxID=266040 RepID=A0ACB7S2Y8_HYAAI|nr:hypothetical protein HPB50_010566 [Hyalomma asiaticum]